MKKLYQKFFAHRESLTMKEYNQARFLFTLEAGILPWVTTAAGGSYLAGFLAMLGASDALSGVLLPVPRQTDEKGLKSECERGIMNSLG